MIGKEREAGVTSASGQSVQGRHIWLVLPPCAQEEATRCMAPRYAATAGSGVVLLAKGEQHLRVSIPAFSGFNA